MLPSEALLRALDLLTAYARVEQRAAEVEEAKAECYPKFSLNLTDGMVAASYLRMPAFTDNLFSSALGAASPILNTGRINAAIAESESHLHESELQLNQTMPNALKEIEDTRSDLMSSASEVNHLTTALDSAGRAPRLWVKLYKNGTASFLDVLDANESHLVDNDSLNQAKRAHALSAVDLYRALSGGWRVAANDLA